MPQKTQASSVRLSRFVPLGFVVLFSEVNVPLDIVAVVFLRQAPMKRYVLFEVPEVGLERVGGLWDARVVEEPEHVGQSPADVNVGLPDHLVREPFRMGRFADGLVVEVADVLAMPFAEHLLPIEHVVARLYIAD